jgi:hypothetical protein
VQSDTVWVEINVKSRVWNIRVGAFRQLSRIPGAKGDEVIHVLLDVMYAKAPYTVVQRAMHIHPTVAVFLPTVLSRLEPFIS